MEGKAVDPPAAASYSIAIQCSRAALILSAIRSSPRRASRGSNPQAEENWRQWAVTSAEALARERSTTKRLERIGELEVILLVVLLTCVASALLLCYIGLL